ncbi:MAG: hypothetical protein A3F42_00535 [Gammaproteobacteria bacterium RIFCSPHIGHO2_12_FULL_37_34]|nr:MAG: hypothetical protein A3F42_00535 [Gammaproteobacteria bacterium RIFCSPHIGHO2_12_FULL_37_34]
MRYILICFILFLSACSSLQKSAAFTGRTNQYLTAKNIPPLKIPPGLSSDAFHSYYPISEKNYPNASKIVSIVPPGLYSKPKFG